MVQPSAAVASLWSGRWRKFTPPQQRLLVACGAAAGICLRRTTRRIAGSFFVAEIILGSIAMESLGPLAIAAVVAALTVRVLTNAAQLYHVPSFKLYSPWEMGPYILLGLIAGILAPWFLRSLRASERMFIATKLPRTARLIIGGLIVGALAIRVPEVCGNGYSVVVDILNGNLSNLVGGLHIENHNLLWIGLSLVFRLQMARHGGLVWFRRAGRCVHPVAVHGRERGLSFRHGGALDLAGRCR